MPDEIDAFLDAKPVKKVDTSDIDAFLDASPTPPKKEGVGVGMSTYLKRFPVVGQAAGVVEAAAQIGSGLAGAAYGGLSGIASLMSGGGLEGAVNAVTQAQQDMTYMPMTQEGQLTAKAVAYPMEKGSELLADFGRAQGGAMFPYSGGAEVGEAIGGVTLPIAGTLLGGASALKSVKGQTVGQYLPKEVPVLSEVKKALTQDGRVQLAEETLRNLVPKGEVPQVISALERRGGEVVPGSPVTSADAIARANRELMLKGKPERFGGTVVSAQEELSKIPETSSQLNTIRALQEQARKGTLAEGAGTEPMYAKAMEVRASNSKANYGALERTVVEAEDFLANLMNTPAMQSATKVAERISANEQRPFSLGQNKPAQTIPSQVLDASGKPLSQITIPAEFAKYPVSSLHDVKMALDKMISKPESFTDFGIGAADVGAMKQVRGQLIDWLVNKSKPYEKANTQYVIDSVPLNRMNLWRALQDKFISPKGDEAPGAYLKVLRDEKKLIKDATRLTGKTNLDQIFNTKDSALAARLAAEMEMELYKQKMGKEVRTQGVGKSAEGLEPSLPNMLYRPTMIANWIIKKLAKDAEVDVNIAAARILADPKMLASVLKHVNQAHRKSILKGIKDIAINKNTAALGVINMTDQEGEEPTGTIEVVGGANEPQDPALDNLKTNFGVEGLIQ